MRTKVVNFNQLTVYLPCNKSPRKQERKIQELNASLKKITIQIFKILSKYTNIISFWITTSFIQEHTDKIYSERTEVILYE